MRLDLSPLVHYQAQLDDRIHTTHNETRASTRTKRILALMVEIAELANETRSFKYWSVRGANARSELLEEFIDTIHFTLSLGLDLNQHSAIVEASPDADLNQLFIDWMQACCTLEHTFDAQHYQALLTYVPRIAATLGFSEAEILASYVAKNEKNHQRQNEAY
jgi:dimeric dUTPase (all-alpha-NTP-PPase superfamily)